MQPILDNCLLMVLDDDTFQLNLLQRMLTRLDIAGCSIRLFSQGSAALDFLTTQPEGARLLIMDLNMPEMDGVEMIRQLAGLKYDGALVLVSGEDPRILETAARLAAAHHLRVLGHLVKPVRQQDLADTLGQWSVKQAAVQRKDVEAYTPEEVQRAIERRELYNVYQPKVDFASGALVGVETLVRWLHPQQGEISSGLFVGIAEEHGLIDGLTKLVLAEALEQGRRWHDEGLPLRISVNLSMANLAQLDIADHVLGELARTGFPAPDLILEVTESRLMQDALVPLDVLTRLRLKHIGLSIDDFGTGHSSLAQLRDMPFDELKIDYSFVHGASRKVTLRGIVEGSLSIARQLGITAVAEGVEDLDDWLFLRQRNCDLAQGYLIAKPMRAESLRPWLAQWTARLPEFLDR